MDPNTLDSILFHFINQGTANSVFDVLMPFMSSKGYTLIFPFGAYILWAAGRQKEEDHKTLILCLWTIAIAVTACFFSDWMANELKHVLKRVRPCHVLDGVRLLGTCTASSSMPSGHATNSFAYAVPLFYMTRDYVRLRWRVYPLLVAALVAYSRPYTGVHYPGDIMVGALFGTAIAGLMIFLFSYARRRFEVQPHTTVLYGILFVLSVFRIYYITSGPLDISPDEAHYWEWTRHLDLSYYSKGPMIAYLIAIGTIVFGDTVFGVRWLAIVLSALSSILLYKLTFEMYKDEAAALGSALMLQIIPLFAAFGVIFSIDSPFVFFWILSLYLFHKAVAEHAIAGTVGDDDANDGHGMVMWVLLGISVGCGLLAKYTMAFFHAGALIFLFMSDRRHLLKTIKPYAAGLISLIVFSPVIIWNYQHDWVTLRHTAGQAHVAEGLTFSISSISEFIGSQIGLVTPLIFVLIFFALHKLYHSEKGYRSTFLFAFSIPVIAFFVLKSIQGKVQANWAMTGYITGIIAVAWYFLRDAAPVSPRAKKALIVSSLVTALAITIVSHYPRIINLPLKLDPTKQTRGWHQLGYEVSPVYRQLSAVGEVFLFSDRYQVSSELAFYVQGHPKVYCINLGRRMNQYDLWPDMNQDAERIHAISPLTQINGIFVTWGDTDVPPVVAAAFDRFEKKIIKVYDRGNELRVYTVIICYNFKGIKTRDIKSY